MKPFLRAVVLVAAAVLSACAAVSKIDTGEVVVRERLVLRVDTPWNKFERGVADDTPTWTIEGITVDALQFYVGIRDGQPIASTPSGARGTVPLTFRATMLPNEVVALYEGLLTRDGSTFTLEKLEPAEFVGTPGFRFEYSRVRKLDDVRLRGVAWGAVRNGELFVMHYSAPRLGFFPKYVDRVETLARSARVRG
jgi:hypothetical protein